MKQKAKIYKGKRIVMGNKNLVTKNEIHVNDIPQEGGESGGDNEGGGTASSFKYIDVTTISPMPKRVAVVLLAYQWKVPDGIYMVGQTLMDGLYETLTPQITAASFDFSRKYTLLDGGVVTLGDQLNTLLPDLTEITEEEFYTLN